MAYINPKIRLFFDFYTIYDLYLRVGGYRDIGYDRYQVFVNERIYDRIKDKYESIVETMYQQLYEALVYSVKSELKHFPTQCTRYNIYNTNSSTFWKECLYKTGISRGEIGEIKRNVAQHSDKAYLLFSKIRWECEYGGKRWAGGAKLIVDARNLKTTHDKVGWCDKVLDLYHNNGHLINKTRFCVLSERLNLLNNSTPLNFRARSRSIFRFLPYTSLSVKNLVLARKNLFDNSLVT